MAIASATEVLVTVQFEQPLEPLTALQIASFFSVFSSNFPAYSQVQWAGPMAYRMTQADGSEPFPVQQWGMPRLRFGDMIGGRYILFQQDRISYGWQRTTQLNEPDGYPGFESILLEAKGVVQAAVEWLTNNLGGAPTLMGGEIHYGNAFEMSGKRLSDVYSFLAVTNPPLRLGAYNYAWSTPMEVANGILSVAASGPAVVAKIADPHQSAEEIEGVHVTLLTLTGTFMISDASQLDGEFLTVRKHIGEIFTQLVKNRENL